MDCKNIQDAFHPVCNSHTDDSRQPYMDPVITVYLGICPEHYSYGLFEHVQNILVAGHEDVQLLE